MHGDGADGSAQIPDGAIEAGYPHILTPNGDVQIDTAQKKIGNASVLFDGTGDYFTVASSNDFDWRSGDFTVEMWIRPAAVEVDEEFFTIGSVDYESLGIFTLSTDSKVHVVASTDGSSWDVGLEGGSLSAETWHHIALVRDGSTFRLFVGGTQVDTDTNAGSLELNNYSVKLGAHYESDPEWWYTGHMDEVRLTKGIARYTSNFDPPLSPLLPSAKDEDCVLLLHFDEADGVARAPDYALGGSAPHEATFVVTAQIDTDQYKFGPSSLLLDGDSDCLSIPDSDDWYFDDDFTIEFWARFTSLTGDPVLCGQSVDATHRWMFYWETDRLRFYVNNGGAGDSALGDAWTPDLDTWYHIAVVLDGSNYKFFVDGISKGSDTCSEALANFAAPLLIGARDLGTPDRFFDGWIDELRISKGVARYTSNFTPPTSKLTQYAGGDSSSSSSSSLSDSSSSSESLSLSGSSSSSSSSSSSDSLSFSSSSSSSSSSSESLSFSSSSSNSQSSSSSSSSSESTSLSSSSSGFGASLLASFDTGGSVPRHVVSAVGTAQLDTAQKKFGTASGLFDGNSDYASIPDSTDFNFGTGNFTIEFWARINSKIENARFCAFTETSATRHAGIYHNTTDGIGFQAYDTGWSTVVKFDQGSDDWSTDTWYHIALVRNGSSWNIYRNGTSVASTTDSSALPDYGSSFLIAASEGGGGGPNSFFDGWIDEFRMSDTARYTTGFTEPTSPFTRDDDTALLLHFDGSDASTRFIDSARPEDGASVSLWPDASGADIDLSQASGSNQPTYRRNQVGGHDAVEFNSSDPSYLRVVRPALNQAQTIFVVGQTDDTSSWHQMISTGGAAIYCNINSANWGLYAGASVNSGQTANDFVIMSAVVHNYDDVELYTDGANKVTGGGSGWINNGELIIGHATTEGFNGMVAGIRVYDEALSDAEREFVESELAQEYFGSSSSSSSSSSESLSSSSSSSSSESTSFSSSSSSNSQSSSSSSSNSQSTSLSSSSSGFGASLLASFDTGGSVPRHVVTANGTAQLDTAQKKFGTASGLFDGNSDYASIPDSTDFNFGTGNFTIEFWARINSKIENARFCAFTETSATRHAGIYHNTTDGIGFQAYDTGWSTVVKFDQGSDDWSTDTWYHIALVRNGSSWNIYRNGTSVASTTDSSALPDYGSSFLIAASEGGGGGPNSFFDGWIDEFRMSDTARYTTGFTEPTSPFTRDDDTALLLHFDGSDASTRFIDSARPEDGASVSLWPDASGADIDLSQASGSNQPTYRRNQVGGHDAVEFNSSDPSYLRVVRPALNQAQTIFVVGQTDDTSSWHQMISTGGAAIYCNINSANWGLYAGASVNSGQTANDFVIMSAVVHNYDDVELYTDGANKVTGGGSGWINNGELIIGHATTEGFNGMVAGIRVYDEALSDAEREFVESELAQEYFGSSSSSSSSSSESFSSSSSSSSSESTSFSSSSSSNSQSSSSSSSNSQSSSSSQIAFDSDAVLLIHGDGADGSIQIPDGAIETGYPHIITPHADAQIDTAQKKVGNASLLFDGTGDYVSIPDSDDWDVTSSDATIEMWIRVNSFPEVVGHLIGQTSTSEEPHDENWFIYLYSDGNIGVGRNGVNEIASTSQPVASTGVWYHVAVVRVNSTSTTTIYVNGTSVASDTKAVWNAASESLRIGSSGAAYGFNGHIDELRISKGVARYTSNFTPPTVPLHPHEIDPHCVLLLHFDEADAATRIPDYALGGNAPHEATCNADAQIDTAQKKYGDSSLLLDGTGDYLSIPDSDDWDFGTDDFTIEAWVRFNSIDSKVYAILGEGRGYSATGPRETGWRIVYNGTNDDLALSRYDGGVDESLIVTWAPAPSADTWYHVAVSKEGDDVKFWINGSQMGATKDATGITYDRAENTGVYIGYHETGVGPVTNYLDGWIDELRISKGVARYTSSFTPPTSKLTQYAGGDSSSSSSSSLSDSSSSSSSESLSFSSSSCFSSSESLSSSSSESTSLSFSSSSCSSSSSSSSESASLSSFSSFSSSSSSAGNNPCVYLCSNDSQAEIFTDGTEPDDNKFWCYTSGEYKPCYMNGTTTAAAATDPCFVEDPDGTPTVCDDVVVDYFSDDFSAGSVDGCRWEDYSSGAGSSSIVGGKLRCAPSTVNTPGIWQGRKSRHPDFSGDFEETVDVTPQTIPTDGSCKGYLYVNLAASFFGIGYGYGDGDAAYNIRYYTGGGGTNITVGSQASLSLRIRRVSGTVYLDYDIGAGWVNATSAANSSDVTESGLYGHTISNPATSPVWDFDNFTIET